MALSHGGAGEQAKVETIRRQGQKTGRNDPYPCGSGKKYTAPSEDIRELGVCKCNIPNIAEIL